MQAYGKNFGLELIRLAARAVFKVRAGHGDASEEFPDGQKTNFNDLEHSLEDHRPIANITNNSEGKKLLINYAVMLVIKYLGERPSKELKQLCRSILLKEQTGITDGLPGGIFKRLGNIVGMGFFIGATIINHSCWPNAVAIFKGKARVIRATDNITSFNEVRISHVDVDLPISERKEELWKDWKIDCNCNECNLVNPGAEER